MFNVVAVGTKFQIVDTRDNSLVSRNGVTEWGNHAAAYGWAQKCTLAARTGGVPVPDLNRNARLGGY